MSSLKFNNESFCKLSISRECSVLFDSIQCADDFSHVFNCHISYYFSEKVKFSTRLQWWKVWDVCYFTQKSGNILKTSLFWKWGAGPRARASARRLPPIFCGKYIFRLAQFCFVRVTILIHSLKLKFHIWCFWIFLRICMDREKIIECIGEVIDARISVEQHRAFLGTFLSSNREIKTRNFVISFYLNYIT